MRFEQVYEPVANSLVLSMLVALIPIVVLFVMLAVFSVPAQWSSLASLAAAFVIAVAVYDMPLAVALNSTLYGVAFGLFLIVKIVVKAMITLRLNRCRKLRTLPSVTAEVALEGSKLRVLLP